MEYKHNKSKERPPGSIVQPTAPDTGIWQGRDGWSFHIGRRSDTVRGGTSGPTLTRWTDRGVPWTRADRRTRSRHRRHRVTDMCHHSGTGSTDMLQHQIYLLSFIYLFIYLFIRYSAQCDKQYRTESIQ